MCPSKIIPVEERSRDEYNFHARRISIRLSGASSIAVDGAFSRFAATGAALILELSHSLLFFVVCFAGFSSLLHIKNNNRLIIGEHIVLPINAVGIVRGGISGKFVAQTM